MIEKLSLIMAFVIIFVAVLQDVRAFRISNKLIIMGAVSGIVMQVIRVINNCSIEEYITGAGTGFLIMLGLYLFKAVGAGDVKLMCVLGLLLGRGLLINLLIMSGVSGIVVGGVEMCVGEAVLVRRGSFAGVHGFHVAVAVMAGYVIVLGNIVINMYRG